jgi:hypothetical protein
MRLAYYDKFNKEVEFDIKPVMPEMKLWKTQCRIICIGEINGKQVHIDIPEGSETDGASIPVVLRPIVGGVWGKYGPGAVTHDDLYKGAGIHGFTRNECDLIFYGLMDYLGCSWLRKRTIYAGLYVGGWVAWNRYKNENIKKIA